MKNNDKGALDVQRFQASVPCSPCLKTTANNYDTPRSLTCSNRSLSLVRLLQTKARHRYKAGLTRKTNVRNVVVSGQSGLAALL